MGVFKWLRRERVTVTTRRNLSPEPTTQDVTQIGTIRTEEYKRDLAEFQARRSFGNKELEDTLLKKKCARHSLPVSCTTCTTDPDNTFNYEKRSTTKYKKKTHKRTRSATSDEKIYKCVPNINFLFQNQVFMPGNKFSAPTPHTEPSKSKRQSRHRPACRSPDMDLVQRQINFKEDVEQPSSPPMNLFYKNNSLSIDVNNFLNPMRSDDEVDRPKAAGDNKVSSQSSECVYKEDSCEDKLWEVMSELKDLDQWADEQLQVRSLNTSKSEDNKSDTSAYGLPITSASNLDVTMNKNKTWNQGMWGVVPVQIKKLTGVTIGHVKKKRNTEINILRKYRHPNIILLMGLYPDVHKNVHIICERCVDTLFDILHVQGQILTVQTSVQYALDIANALVFLRMQGYIHTELNSASIMLTSHDTAKLADLGPCTRLSKMYEKKEKGYEIYSPEPQYVNIEDNRQCNTPECEPLISKNSSETYLNTQAVAKDYNTYRQSEQYRWQAPELFVPDDGGVVYACGRSDVYSLCLILWESCNAAIPWKSLTYDKLNELYILWKTGIYLPQDGTYPGCLLALLQRGLVLRRDERIDLDTLQSTLQNIKRKLDNIEYIIIPARLTKKKSDFSSKAWDTTSPTDSESTSPKKDIQHKAVIHKTRDSSTDSSEKDCSKSDHMYETVPKSATNVNFELPEKCNVSDDDSNKEKLPILKYEHLPEKDYSSACSTPIAKLKARMKDIGTPGALHRSDSTEYCSILSPDQRTFNFGPNDDSTKDQNSVERPTTKLSRSFTPKSYKPLHIKVPEFNLDCIKSLPKEHNGSGRSSYNFDIKNYSLPTTPIARSNKLRKNAWLSGDLNVTERSLENLKDNVLEAKLKEFTNTQPPHDTPIISNNSSFDKEQPLDNNISCSGVEQRSEVVDSSRDNVTGLRRIDHPQDFVSTETDEVSRERTNSWSFRSSFDRSNTKCKVEEDVLSKVNVKPLVAIHEKWIYEANRKAGRSMSLPEDNRNHALALKPASHCVDTLQKSFPQLSTKRVNVPKPFRACSSSLNKIVKNGSQLEQFCQARDAISKSMNIGARDSDYFIVTKTQNDKSTMTEDRTPRNEAKIDQSTETRNIEEIKEIIRKEFQCLLLEMSDDSSTITSQKNEDLINRGIANVLETLKNSDDQEQTVKRDAIKSFSRVKINGNNKPLLQITFSRSGENSLQVLDNCVNVTIRDANTSGREKLNQSMEETLTLEDFHINSLKRCQTFSAIQEARSTEDLYIDDDISTQMQENFGGKVKLIPLHGSLHEILCEKEDDCCLIKVKQENGCDTIYFRCDASDTEPRDAVDAPALESGPQDTVLYKRSISLIEERIQRILPREKRTTTPVVPRKLRKDVENIKIRPKSEVFIQNINAESRALSNSSPSLIMKDNDEVEVNIENVLSYQDSSSEECLKCQTENDDFELLERKIEEDIANGNKSTLTCGCLAKISEENLSVINDDVTENRCSVDEMKVLI